MSPQITLNPARYRADTPPPANPRTARPPTDHSARNPSHPIPPAQTLTRFSGQPNSPPHALRSPATRTHGRPLPPTGRSARNPGHPVAPAQTVTPVLRPAEQLPARLPAPATRTHARPRPPTGRSVHAAKERDAYRVVLRGEGDGRALRRFVDALGEATATVFPARTEAMDATPASTSRCSRADRSPCSCGGWSPAHRDCRPKRSRGCCSRSPHGRYWANGSREVLGRRLRRRTTHHIHMTRLPTPGQHHRKAASRQGSALAADRKSVV